MNLQKLLDEIRELKKDNESMLSEYKLKGIKETVDAVDELVMWGIAKNSNTDKLWQQIKEELK